MTTDLVVMQQQTGISQADLHALMLAMLGKQKATSADRDDQLVESWLKTRGKGKLRTVRAYANDVSEFFTFLGGQDLNVVHVTGKARGNQAKEQVSFVTGGRGLQALTVEDVQAFKDYLADAGYSLSTQTRKLSAVRSLLSYAQTTGYCVLNVGAPVKPPKVQRELAQRILTEEQVHAMIAKTDDQRDHALLRTLYYTGARVGSICLLQWRHVRSDNGAGILDLYNEKADDTLHITIPATLLLEIEELRPDDADPDAFVFESQKGGQLDASQVWRIVRNAAQRAKIKGNVSPHWLRHSHVSHALDRGVAPHVVQQTVGHSSLDITTNYAHVKAGESSALALSA